MTKELIYSEKRARYNFQKVEYLGRKFIETGKDSVQDYWVYKFSQFDKKESVLLKHIKDILVVGQKYDIKLHHYHLNIIDIRMPDGKHYSMKGNLLVSWKEKK